MAKRNNMPGVSSAAISPTRERVSEVKKSNKTSHNLKKVIVSNMNSASKGSYFGAASVLLPDATTKRESEMTAVEKMDLVREGVSKKDLEHLKEKAQLVIRLRRL